MSGRRFSPFLLLLIYLIYCFIQCSVTLCEKCPNAEFFFWPLFSRIQSNKIQENTDKEKTPYLDNFHVVINYCSLLFRIYYFSFLLE